MNRLIFAALFASLSPIVASAASTESDARDKSHYTLFNATPREEMREWRTDHAGVSPYTIDAGHFEAEVTGVSYAYSELPLPFAFGFDAKARIEQWVFGGTVLKAGLLNSLDAEVSIVPYQRIRQQIEFVDFASARTVTRTTDVGGFGNTSGRLKWNLWGNDGGKTALSLCSTVTFPTASDHFVDLGYQGGPSLEFAAQLPWQFELRIDAQGIFYKDFADHLQSTVDTLLSLNRNLTPNLNVYAIFAAYVYSGDTSETVIRSGGSSSATFVRYSSGEWRGYAKTGFNYRIGKNVELFAGCSFGIHGSFAADYNPFVGIGARF